MAYMSLRVGDYVLIGGQPWEIAHFSQRRKTAWCKPPYWCRPCAWMDFPVRWLLAHQCAWEKRAGASGWDSLPAAA